MGGLKASRDSFCICKREVPFADDFTISDHYSPALTLALTAYHLAYLRRFASRRYKIIICYGTPFTFIKSCRLDLPTSHHRSLEAQDGGL